jgi:hypothetical protein
LRILACAGACVAFTVGDVSLASAATLRVCASGCAYTNLQPALAAAQPGDTILLRAGETFAGNFTLPVKSGTAFITIRSDAPDSSLPAAGVRLIPQGRPGANTSLSALARIVGLGGSLKTTPVLHAAPGAHNYRLQFINFDGAAQLGYETLLSIGTDKYENQPHDIIFDRVYIHGHPTKGQKRGLALNGGKTDIINSYLCDIKSVGEDSVGIGGWNGAGPYHIINNYIEAAGENILFGGASPATPNLIPSDIVISGNTVRKDLAWRNNVLKAPTSLRVSGISSGGSLPSATHHFKVLAVLHSSTRDILSAPSNEVAAATGAGGKVTLAWAATPNAEKYRIYRGAGAGGESVYMTTTSAATTFTYTGSGEKSGKPGSGNHWVAKNLLVLKNAQRVTVDRNLFENNWTGDQNGYALVFTPRNPANTTPWVAVRDVTVTNNVVRHSAAAINILGYDTNVSTGSQLAERLTFRNNLFYDISPSAWGGGLPKCIEIGHKATDIVFDHNTFDQATNGILGPYGAPMPGFVFTNNIGQAGRYGVMGGGTAQGNPTITKYFPGGVFTHNVFAGAQASIYPPTNLFPTVAQFLASFVNRAAGDYTLLSTSVFFGGGTSGGVPGVDMVALTSPAGEGDSNPDQPPTGPDAVAGGPYSTTTTTDVTVNGSASSAPGSSLTAYRWDWADDVLLQLSAVPTTAIHGAWKKMAVAGASTGTALVNPNAGKAKVAAPAASPSSYVDIHFVAAAGVPYRVWFRGRAQNDYYGNDSFYVQFSDAVDSLSRSIAPIGTTQGLAMVLEEGNGAGLSAWGWNDAGYGNMAAPVYFASSGDHVIRLQPREDGIELDQIVISSVAYASKRPGATKKDTTVIPAKFGTASGVTATHRYSRVAVYPLRLTVTDANGAKASDTTTVNVKSGGSASLQAVPGGPYQGTAGTPVALDGTQSTGTISSATWRVFDDIVLRGDAIMKASRHGSWKLLADGTAADGVALSDPDGGAAKISTAKATPTNYVDLTFRAGAHVPYRLWLRMRAARDYYGNDSVFVQFNDAMTSGGSATARIGTTSALPVVLEEGNGGGDDGWGWNDANYGGLAAPVYFATSGVHTVRIQRREDGAQIDQIVLSSGDYYASRPGRTTGDSTLVPDTLDVVSGLKASHVFPHAGTYPLQLRVVGGSGTSSTANTSVTVK